MLAAVAPIPKSNNQSYLDASDNLNRLKDAPVFIHEFYLSFIISKETTAIKNHMFYIRCTSQK